MASAARHREGARKGFGALLWTFFWKLKWQYFPLLLSDYGREILRRKYDAIATDRAYENRPSGLVGPLGRAVDALVLGFPLHEGLRQRLRLVVVALEAEVRRAGAEGHGEVRVLSAPCGLARDLVTLATRLRRDDPALAARLRLLGVDLDETGEVIPLASSRAAAAGVPVSLHRADLFDAAGLERLLGSTERYHVVNCIGLTAWLDLPDVARLARHFRERLLVEGGALIVDNFAVHPHSHLGKDLEMNTRYHDSEAFARTLQASGFHVESATPTQNGVNSVYVARAV